MTESENPGPGDAALERAERAFCKARRRDYEAYQGYYTEALRAALEAALEPHPHRP